MDLNIQALQAKGLAPDDVVSAIGDSKPDPARRHRKNRLLGRRRRLKCEARKPFEEMNDLPIKTVGENTIYVRDVAHVRDGNPPQTNIVLVDGQRAALMTILKLGRTSTLDVINKIKEALPVILAGLPPGVSRPTDCRPIALCPRLHQRSCSRSRHCRLPHRDHDSDFFGKLAQHADYRGFDSSFDSHVDHRPERNRTDHQHHDAGRPGAGGRHPGG